ncbi:MAG: VWA domain-containing protein [Anaerolineae bacterium]|nr:VWA domain-containing protein [Anaerolineae bacterium]
MNLPLPSEISSSQPSHGELLRNIVLFGRLLRALGLDVTPTQIIDFVDGLRHINIGHRRDFKETARAVMVNNYEHLALFDKAFDLFWQERKAGELNDMNLGELMRRPPEQKEETVPIAESAGGTDSDQPQEQPQPEIVYTYSAREVLRRKDFGELGEEELVEVNRMMQAMHWRLEQRRTRRKKRTTNGRYLDLRRTIRQNLRYGGEPLQLTWRKPKLKRRPLVVISDISGSMERYARILLKFIYVISNGLDKVESFVFSTRLTRITYHLKHHDIDTALDEATGQIHDWAGGTRIGESLKTFNYEWGRRVLGHGAIVLIISDGWDRGDISLLDHEMQRLQLSCHRLIWLNPLLGSNNYEPLTRGIVAAMPYIDDFLPVHNLHSLEQLGDLLLQLGEHKPVRRHHAA